MITTTNVFKKVADTLRESFGIKVYDTETREGFIPECFYLELVAPSVTRVTGTYKKEEFSLRVTFIPETEMDLARVFEIKDKLMYLFDDEMEIEEDFYCHITEQNFMITTNNCLEMLISTEMVQEVEKEDDTPLMADIEIK